MPRRPAVLAFALFVVLSGCHSGSDRVANAPRTERPSATPGWKEVSTSGVVFQLPNDWKTIDFARDKLEDAVSKAFGNDPKFDRLRAQVNTVAKQGGIKFYAIDASPSRGRSPIACNVVSQNVGLEVAVEQVADRTAQHMRTVVVSGTEPKVEYRTGPYGKMAIIRAEIKAPDPAVPQFVSLAHMVMHGPVIVIVTFSGPVTDEAHIKEIAGKAMENFRFTL